jgi:SOS-response transcriptional repressor LexA
MHTIQEKILAVAGKQSLKGLSLRAIGDLIGEHNVPMTVKHHLTQLEKRGLLKIDWETKTYETVKRGTEDTHSNFVNVPILGAADCGPARQVAEARPQGYLKMSKRILKNGKGVFALRAHGHSMNKAKIRGLNNQEKNIEDGDYVLVDSKYVEPKNGDYVLSVIDGSANIKKFFADKENAQVILMSESSHNYPPIYIHWAETGECIVNGRIVDVIKKPKG